VQQRRKKPITRFQLGLRKIHTSEIFQGKILDEYDHMVSEFGLTVIDGTQAIRTQQRQMRELVSRYLKETLKEKAVPGR